MKNRLEQVNIRLGLSNDLTKEKNKNIVFLYCPPKVGSTSLVTSLRLSCSNKMSILHIHDENMLDVLCGIKDIKIKEIIEYNRNLGKNITIIDIFRTPIEHKISTFFENISYHFNNKEENINTYDINIIIKRFNELFPYFCNTDYYRQIYEISHINEFNYEKKYLLQIINGIRYVKLRLKDANLWSNILYEIFRLPVIIVKDYESQSRAFSQLFKKFNLLYKIPINYLNDINNYKLDYYLSSEEKKDYINNWNNKIDKVNIPFTIEQYNLYSSISRENQYYFNIQQNHYIDEGCSCLFCSKKRYQLLKFIISNKNEKIKEKDYIIHSNVINEYNNNKNNIKKNLYKKIQQLKKHNIKIQIL